MPYLVRKITKSKWNKSSLETVSDLHADVITNCLKTNGNTLSFWKIDDKEQIDEAILALAASVQRLDTIDIVIIEEQSVLDKNLNIQESPGVTAVEDVRNSHRDICLLSYDTIGSVAELIMEEVKAKRDIRVTTTRIKDVLNKAIRDQRLSPQDLDEKMAKKLEVAA